MDIYTGDPLGTIRVTTEGIGEIGKRIESLGLPCAVIMEGGYANEMLGTNILRFLGELK
jgi:acetoin utilization deacetylase AcuC-like enzyme